MAGQDIADQEKLTRGNETLIENWNRRVHRDDTVYILGDLMFRNICPPADYLVRMKGKKHLIVGNHDRYWMKKLNLEEHFISVSSLLETSDGQHKLVLCHYPMMAWNGAGRGTYLIHGHIHNNRHSAYWPLLRSMEHALNAGVDINGFAPATFEELLVNNLGFKQEEMPDAGIE